MSYKSFKRIMIESISDIVYHNTTVSNLSKILHDDAFLLTSSLGTDADTMYKGEKFKPYFLSTSRIKFGGYARSMNPDNIVCIVLNGRLLNQRFYGGAVDYWGREYRSDIKSDFYLRNNENEDRLFLDKEKIDDASKYIKELHIMKHPNYIMMQDDWKTFQMLSDDKQTETFRYSALYKEIIKNASVYDIPVYFYKNFNDFKLQNKAKADIITDSFDSLSIFIELLQKNIISELSKKAYEEARDVMYYNDSDVRQLKNHIHNNRSDVYENKKLGVLTRLMSKNKLKTIDQLFEFLRNKWRNIIDNN